MLLIVCHESVSSAAAVLASPKPYKSNHLPALTMKRLQPLAPLGPVRAHQLPTLAIDSSLNRGSPSPASPALPASASPISPRTLTTPRSARTPRTDGSHTSSLPDVKLGSGRQAEREEKEAERSSSARELERRKQRDMERMREAQKDEQAKLVRRRSSSSGPIVPAIASLSPINSARDAQPTNDSQTATTPRSPAASSTTTALPVASTRSPETPRRGKEALSPLSPPSARRALPPLIPTTRATSDSANGAVQTPTAEKPKREKKMRANQDKQHKVKSDKKKKRQEESKEDDDVPASPSVSVGSASSADSSDSETEKEDIEADKELLHTLAVTEPLAAAPIIAAEAASLGLSATQPLPDTAHEPQPPHFPPPLPFQPPTADSSRTLSFYIGTWNLHGRPFPADSTLAAFLPPQPADVVCVGTEECDMSIERAVLLAAVDKGGKERWVRKVHAMIGQDEYVKVEEESMVAMHVVVFVRKELAMYVCGVDKARVATGVGNVIGNKGGVGVCMNVGSTSILFINSHFAAHQHAVDKRNGDFWAISNKLNLRPKPPAASSSDSTNAPSTPTIVSTALSPAPLPVRSSSSTSASAASLVTERFDRVFWLGDLNYRIEGTHRLVCHLLQSDHLQPLLNNDQLTRTRLTQAAFTHFHEQAITFKPTYKVDPNTAPTVYDSSRKQRVPGWTDRVLWRDGEGGGGVEAVEYGSCEAVRSSDHFPVYARFRVRVDGMVARVKEESKEAEVSEKKRRKKKEKEASNASKSSADRTTELPSDSKAKSAHEKSTAPHPTTAAAASSDPRASKLAHHSSMSTQGESANSTVDSARAARGSVIEMSLVDGAAEDGSPRRSVSAVTADAPIATEQDSKVCAIM